MRARRRELPLDSGSPCGSTGINLRVRSEVLAVPWPPMAGAQVVRTGLGAAQVVSGGAKLGSHVFRRVVTDLTTNSQLVFGREPQQETPADRRQIWGSLHLDFSAQGIDRRLVEGPSCVASMAVRHNGARTKEGGVMIAQVRTLPVPDTQPSADQMAAARKVGQEACARQRAVDGCEGVVILGNHGVPSLAVTFWRDEAAMKAGASYQAEEISTAQQANPAMPHIPEPEVLEVLAGA